MSDLGEDRLSCRSNSVGKNPGEHNMVLFPISELLHDPCILVEGRLKWDVHVSQV